MSLPRSVELAPARGKNVFARLVKFLVLGGDGLCGDLLGRLARRGWRRERGRDVMDGLADDMTGRLADFRLRRRFEGDDLFDLRRRLCRGLRLLHQNFGERRLPESEIACA